jgi:hypothetical protein
MTPVTPAIPSDPTWEEARAVITLSNAGEMYFICPTPGASAQGMKLAVNVSSDGGAPLANLMLGV